MRIGTCSFAHSALCILPSALLCLAVSALAAGETIDRVLAVAAGELITLSDVMAARDFGLVTVEDGADPIGAILAKLIDRELILAEVDRYAPPEPAADAIDRELQKVQARFASPQAFDEALSRSGIDASHLRQTLRDNLRIRAYEDQRFTTAPPTDEELGRYYRDHPQTFMREGRPAPFDAVREDVGRAMTGDRRATLIADWIAGLRRRADIIDLYLPGR
jgi:parvulin-like peptidyl-prolyl isomerase